MAGLAAHAFVRPTYGSGLAAGRRRDRPWRGTSGTRGCVRGSPATPASPAILRAAGVPSWHRPSACLLIRHLLNWMPQRRSARGIRRRRSTPVYCGARPCRQAAWASRGDRGGQRPRFLATAPVLRAAWDGRSVATPSPCRTARPLEHRHVRALLLVAVQAVVVASASSGRPLRPPRGSSSPCASMYSLPGPVALLALHAVLDVRTSRPFPLFRLGAGGVAAQAHGRLLRFHAGCR